MTPLSPTRAATYPRRDRRTVANVTRPSYAGAGAFLPDLTFCPACGEPAAQRQSNDFYACRHCALAGEISGFTPPDATTTSNPSRRL